MDRLRNAFGMASTSSHSAASSTYSTAGAGGSTGSNYSKMQYQSSSREEAFMLYIQKLVLKAETHEQSQNWPTALYYRNKILVKQREWYGLDTIETADTLNKIGLLLTKMGEEFSAMTALQEALFIRQKCLGAGHDTVVETTNNMWKLLDMASNGTAPPPIPPPIPPRIPPREQPQQQQIMSNKPPSRTPSKNYDEYGGYPNHSNNDYNDIYQQDQIQQEDSYNQEYNQHSYSQFADDIDMELMELEQSCKRRAAIKQKTTNTTTKKKKTTNSNVAESTATTTTTTYVRRRSST